ncbi:uncharacterized protein LOC108810519 isoform X1 [Raphanus sativus]|uniref:Uncharacterized protein LOC108810519 isoform X1 n=1 Tax=Raphanus sativus TaxID=3726 RepID=A0A9W3C103_RAPSA|nr:uncharacterized protein LOC108810519 isoform X1 [Raphanus sativus]
MCVICSSLTLSSSKYYRQTETDVEMPLNPSRVLYEMNSDDEQFLARIHDRVLVAENSASYEITENMFEKASYVKQLDHFTLIEIQELMAGARSLEAMKTIYELWRTKRQSKGMPLIMHLQTLYGSLRTWVDHQIFTISQHSQRRKAMMMMEMPGT